MAKLVAGVATDATPLERELLRLVRKAHITPRQLSPADLAPLREFVDAGALDYALVIGSFHFIIRIADLLDVSPDLVPERLARFEPIRRLGTRLVARVFRSTMDLATRPYEFSYAQAAESFGPTVERALGVSLATTPLGERPKLIEALALMFDERDLHSSLAPEVRSRIEHVVETALPNCVEDVEGLHARPGDAVDAFAFVGTRYPHRTTGRMIEAVRAAGYDDLGILDLAIAIADANNWARLRRLLGLPAGYDGFTAAESEPPQ